MTGCISLGPLLKMNKMPQKIYFVECCYSNLLNRRVETLESEDNRDATRGTLRLPAACT